MRGGLAVKAGGLTEAVQGSLEVSNHKPIDTIRELLRREAVGDITEGLGQWWLTFGPSLQFVLEGLKFPVCEIIIEIIINGLRLGVLMAGDFKVNRRWIDDIRREGRGT